MDQDEPHCLLLDYDSMTESFYFLSVVGGNCMEMAVEGEVHRKIILILWPTVDPDFKAKVMPVVAIFGMGICIFNTIANEGDAACNTMANKGDTSIVAP